MKNVILVTTMWNMLRDELEGEGLRRQQDLIDEFWRPLIYNGAFVSRFDGTPASAFSLVSQLAGREAVVLDYQKQIVDDEYELSHTTAGTSLLQKLETTKVEYTLKLTSLEKELEEAVALGDKPAIKDKERETAEVKEMLKWIDRSVEKLEAQPGPRIKRQIARVMTGESMGHAVTALAAILNIALFVVRVVVGA